MKKLTLKESITVAPGETVIVNTDAILSDAEISGAKYIVVPEAELEALSKLRICVAPNFVPTENGGVLYGVQLIIHNTSERYYTDGAGQVKVMPNRETNHNKIKRGETGLNFSSNITKGWYDIEAGTPIAKLIAINN